MQNDITILVTTQEDSKQLSVAWKLTALRGCPFLQKFIYQGGQRATHLYTTGDDPQKN